MDRPLKGRGIRDAYNTASWLVSQGYIPDLIVSSPATRALHTALIFAKELDYAYRDIAILGAIYEANSNTMYDVVQNINDKYSNVFLFGHNPTITNFVNECIDHKIDNVPTTGVACLKFDEEHWRDVATKAELMFFDFPKRRKAE